MKIPRTVVIRASRAGVCFHFTAETFAERSKWVKLLDSTLRGIAPQSLLLHRELDGTRLSNSVVSPERLMMTDSLSALRIIEAGNKEGGDDEAENVHGPTLSETMQTKSKDMEELIAAKSDLCVERELNRRLERKIRILEKGVVETRHESEGLRSALMAAQDRIALFTSNSVPCAGIVSQVWLVCRRRCGICLVTFEGAWALWTYMNLFAWTQMYLQSASNWLQVEADKESLESSVDLLIQQANDLDELLLSASGRYNPLPK